MEYNPYETSHAYLMKEIASAESDRRKRFQQIEWYDSFDADATFSALQEAMRKKETLGKRLETVNAHLERQKSWADRLRKETEFSFSRPFFIFTAEHSAKKAALESIERDVAQQRSKQPDLQEQILKVSALIDRQQEDLKRHRACNRQEDEAVVRALSIALDQLNNQLGPIRQQKERVDEQLAKPLGDLKEFKQRKGQLEADIRRAEGFKQQLSDAANSYERKQIHDCCNTIFGESKPAEVIRDKRRELQSVNRNIDKLEERLRTISMRATRVIKTIVIDGNNLCHQQESFIGLAALQALAQRLSNEYSVIIVFDPTIRGLLRMHNREIAKQFDNAVKVHIASHAADETILDTAEDIGAYVISNDRFQDYRDKSAVRDQRILRHEILDNRIFIHDLSVAECFKTE